MYTMHYAAYFSQEHFRYFALTCAFLLLMGLIISAVLYDLAGFKALYFAAAPTLLLYGFMNWDLLAVMFATAAVWAYLKNKPAWSGIYLALGASAKIYPALFLIPFCLDAVEKSNAARAVRMLLSFCGTWLAVNLPFMIFAWKGWSTTFRFNTLRQADADSLWKIASLHLLHHAPHNIPLINALSFFLFVSGTVLIWLLMKRRRPDFPRWTLGFPMLIILLLVSKVISPQYALWVLPWVALVMPNPLIFALFELGNCAIFLTHFSDPAIYGATEAAHGPLFEIAALLRAASLIICLIAYVKKIGAPSAVMK